MNPEFEQQVARNIRAIGNDPDFLALSRLWVRQCLKYDYTHNFTWLGRPVIQAPQDSCALQQIIWEVKPDLIIETGIAHGGSLILSASMLALLEYADAVAAGTTLDPQTPTRKVLGIDIDIRAHNRAAIDAHPMRSRIEMIEGSSIADDIVAQVRRRAADFQRILVCLDSNHTHAHVLAELQAYAPLVSVGSYCVVMDTGVEDLPEDFCTNRPWGKGNNPKTAVREYLKSHPEFSADKMIEWKIAITAAEDGYLKRLR
ncbi:MAG: cephalosporin hydroxylase family protein [Alphaproteobacteria bacterium]|nr:cephalosporin hydroxylase family protein [Alphaproteobacteria bacterium]